MGKIKIGREIEVLGEELSKKCPNNDCRIFRDTYAAYKSMLLDRQNLMGYIAQATMTAIDRQLVKHIAKLYDMYHHNPIVRAYIRTNIETLTKRYLA